VDELVMNRTRRPLRRDAILVQPRESSAQGEVNRDLWRSCGAVQTFLRQHKRGYREAAQRPHQENHTPAIRRARVVIRKNDKQRRSERQKDPLLSVNTVWSYLF